jgi:hypothetical protein
MSVAALPPAGLTLSNPNRHISRVLSEREDFSLLDHNKTIERMKIDLESSSVVTTMAENKYQQIENIFRLKDPLIQARNNIIDNPFKYYFPYYRKKLTRIDTRLDELDMQLYMLESENELNESNLDKAIDSAELKLKKYSRFLQPK